MNTWLIVLVSVGVTLLALGLLAFGLFWTRRRAARELMRRIGGLPWRGKAQLAGELFGDPRVPLALRIAMPLLVVYLVLPIDLIPDIIPIIGQIDDVILLVLVAGLLLRAVPLDVIGEHITVLEAEHLDAIEGEVSRPNTDLLGSPQPKA
jgi:uncharacterized membrane protein YkvA (DUF1232 family)